VTPQLVLSLQTAPAPTLANFIVGRNAAALDAVRQLAPGRALYLWSAPGCGRSHLLRARCAPGETAAVDAPDGGAPENIDRKAQRRLQAEQRQRLSARRKPLETRLVQTETAMDQVRVRLENLSAAIADPGLYGDERRAERQQVMAEHGELGKQLEILEADWLDIQESLEAIGKEYAT